MRIAIVKLSAMGDIVHAMVSLQYIKAAYPNAQIDWIVERSFADILAHNPHIQHILPIDLKKSKKNPLQLWRQITQLRQYAHAHYDWVIDAQGLIKSAIVAKLLRAPIIGFDAQSIREPIASRFYQRTIHQAYADNVIARNLAVIASSLDVSVDFEAVAHKQAFLYHKPTDSAYIAQLPTEKPRIMLVVGASRPNKMYPNFEEVARLLADSVHITVLSASPTERAIANNIVAANPFNVSTAPQVNLNGMKELISHMDIVIGGDTGPTHCAWGSNIPSLTLFGNTPHERNTYIDNRHRVLKSPSQVNPLKLNHEDNSIKLIPAQQVVQAAQDLLRDTWRTTEIEQPQKQEH